MWIEPIFIEIFKISCHRKSNFFENFQNFQQIPKFSKFSVTENFGNFDTSRKQRSIPFYWYPFYVNWANIHWDFQNFLSQEIKKKILGFLSQKIFGEAIKWTIYLNSKGHFDLSGKKRSIPFYWYPFYVNWADIHWDFQNLLSQQIQ